MCRKEWEEVKGAGREPEKGECKERGVIKKLREVVGEEGGGEGGGRKSWKIMVGADGGGRERGVEGGKEEERR